MQVSLHPPYCNVVKEKKYSYSSYYYSRNADGLCADCHCVVCGVRVCMSGSFALDLPS
jgi:hypothetical protein